MADDLKRVGLVFKADGTADFAKSLKTVNTLTGENYTAFKLAKSQWDKSTTSLDKLKDTQKYLSKQTEAYSTKVYALQEQLNALENAEVRNEQAIAKKRAQLNNAEVNLNKYQKGLEEVNAKLESGQAQIEEYAKKIENFGNKTKEVGEKLSKGVTAPIIGVGTAAMVAWNELDDAYDKIATGTGALGDQLTSVQDSFDNVFGQVGSSADDVATSIANLNTRFGFTGETLEQASVSFLHFASVNNTDVSNAIALVSRAMGDAGIDSKEYATVLDELTAASQSSGIAIDKLTENITKYGAPMRALGFDTKESIALFASWEKAGVNTEIAFSGMKKAISNFAASGKDAKVEFSKTLEEIKKCPDIASATTKAIEVFGTKAGPDLADAIKGGRFEYEDMLNIVQNSQGQLENSFDATRDPIDKTKVALNNLKLVGADLGDEIQSTLAPVFEKLNEVLKDFYNWFKNLNPAIKEALVAIAGIAAAIGPVLVVIGMVSGYISTAVSMFGQLKLALFGATEQAGLIGSVVGALSGPLVALIGILAAVVVAVVQLWNESEGFRNAVNDIGIQLMAIAQSIWAVLEPIFKSFVALLQSVLQNGLIPLWNNFKSLVANIIELISWLLDVLNPVISTVVSLLGLVLVPTIQAILSVASLVINGTIGLFSSFLSSTTLVVRDITQVIKGIIDFVTGIFTGDWTRAWQGIVNIFGGIFKGIIDLCRSPINAVIGLLNGAIGGINTMIDGLNKINFSVPDWVPGLGGKSFGLSLSHIGKIKALAKGGTILEGAAIVGEAGAELIQETSRGTRVTPLTESGGTNKADLIDYDRLEKIIIRAFSGMIMKYDRRTLGKIIREEVNA